MHPWEYIFQHRTGWNCYTWIQQSLGALWHFPGDLARSVRLRILLASVLAFRGSWVKIQLCSSCHLKFFLHFQIFYLHFIHTREEATCGSLGWWSRMRAFISAWLKMKPETPRPVHSSLSLSLVRWDELCSGFCSYCSVWFICKNPYCFPCSQSQLEIRVI